MTFTFDAKTAPKRQAANAKAANPANPETVKPVQAAKISGISSISRADAPFDEYRPADLEEIDRLLRQLSQLENWSADELADKLDQRRRMAPVNVIPALRWLMRVVAEPEPRKKRPFRLCKLEVVELAAIDGGKR